MKQLSNAQIRALDQIEANAGRVRLFPPGWGSTGFAATTHGNHLQYRTVKALWTLGLLREIRRFNTDATSSGINAGVELETIKRAKPTPKPLTMTTVEREKLVDWAHEEDGNESC